MAQMPGDGPTWIGGLAVLPDASGRERMVCHYVKIKPPLTVYRRGLAQWNDEAERFEPVKELPSADFHMAMCYCIQTVIRSTRTSISAAVGAGAGDSRELS